MRLHAWLGQMLLFSLCWSCSYLLGQNLDLLILSLRGRTWPWLYENYLKNPKKSRSSLRTKTQLAVLPTPSEWVLEDLTPSIMITISTSVIINFLALVELLIQMHGVHYYYYYFREFQPMVSDLMMWVSLGGPDPFHHDSNLC